MAAPSRRALLLLVVAGGLLYRAVAALPGGDADWWPPREFTSVATGMTAVATGEVEDLLGADALVFVAARDAGGEERGTLFLAYFRNRKRLAEPHAPEVCYGASGWTMRAGAAHAGMPGKMLFVEKGDARRAVLFWYETRGGLVTTEWRLKLDLLGASLARRPTDALFVRAAVPMRRGETDEAARARLLDFARGIQPALVGLLAGPPPKL